MGSIRYIGSKARLAEDIVAFSGPPAGRFLDLFCGTGAVTAAAADAGWSVLANDHLTCATVLTEAQLTTPEEAGFGPLGGYEQAIRRLNQLAGQPGFIAQQYSPLSLAQCGHERRYFTTDNACRIDSIRGQIHEWHLDGTIHHAEHTVLIADLLEAANAVANIAGTYGCFLKKWTKTGLRTLQLHHRELRAAPVSHELVVGDVHDVKSQAGDIVYLDPPYTKRQYASYYHILETITLHDSPEVSGVCGLRPWQRLASPFCYKRRAHQALLALILRLSPARVLLSYSSEGHVDVNDLVRDLGAHRDVELIPLMEIGRYRPNLTASSNGAKVSEYLIDTRAPEAVKSPDGFSASGVGIPR